MRFVVRIISLFMALSFLIACVELPVPQLPPLSEQSSIVALQTEEPTPGGPDNPTTPSLITTAIVIPDQGKATFGGILYSLNFQRVIPNTAFYLILAPEDDESPPMVLTGPHTERGDILAFSDDQGRFLLDNIPPGRYFLAVWAPLNWILAVNSPVDETPRLFSLRPNDVLQGTVYVPWP